MMGGQGDSEGGRRGYRYRAADVPDTADDDPARPGDDAVDGEEGRAALAGGRTDDDDLGAEAFADDEDEGEDEEDEPPSEFWPAAELLKGATVEDVELELSYGASVYANLPAAELRLWLRLPDGTLRLAQIDEPHAVWLYRETRQGSGDFGEYPDHRFELLCTDLRASRARRQRQLIDRQLALHDEIVAIGEELEQLEHEMRDDATATADWPGTRWP